MTERTIHKSVFTCDTCGLTVDLPPGKVPETWGFGFDNNPTTHLCEGCRRGQRAGESPRPSTSVFDETWEYDPIVENIRRVPSRETIILVDEPVDGESMMGIDIAIGVHDVGRLAAAAPDLFRALLAVEWSANPGGRECPTCSGMTGLGHEPDCALDAALKKAGRA